VLRIRFRGVRHFPGTFRYQMLILLPSHLTTERLQNLLIQCRLFSKPYYSMLQIRLHREISLSGACKSTTCPWGYLSVLCRIGQRCLLAFFKRTIHCNILRNKCLSFRHLLDMSGIRYHRVIPVPKCFGYRLSVRRLHVQNSPMVVTLKGTQERYSIA